MRTASPAAVRSFMPEIFAGTGPQRREWTRSYFAGRLRLDPLVLFHSSRTLKRAVYQDGGALEDLAEGRQTTRRADTLVRLRAGA
jgi:hypothetical protein